jgi:hypothetical protein
MKALWILAALLLTIVRAYAWGDDGHKTVALIGEQFLDPAVKKKITAMLAADPDSLTPHDFASAATWADCRDSNNRRDHYAQTQNWHFIDFPTSKQRVSGERHFRRAPWRRTDRRKPASLTRSTTSQPS